MDHEVLGPCYRVKILEKGFQGERGHIRKEKSQTVDPSSCAAEYVPVAGGRSSAVAAPAENNDDVGGVDVSDSSSSSSSGKKKKEEES